MTAFGVPWWIIAIYVFAIGAIVGSFINVCIHRLPMHDGYLTPLKELWTPPSQCTKCAAAFGMLDNLPIIGWLRTRGRCRSCGLRISWRYPVIELFNGLLVVALYFLNVPLEVDADMSDALLTTPFGPFASDSLLDDLWLAHARFLFHWLLCELLLVAALIDLDLTIIPAIVTDPWIAFGIACSALGGFWLWPLDFDLPYGLVDVPVISQIMASENQPLVPQWTKHWPILHGLAVSIAGALTGFVVVGSIRWVGTKIIGVEAVGAGDVWLMALVGSFLGWQPTIIAMVLSLGFAFGTIAVRIALLRFEPVPYGPYLSLGSATTLMAWPWIWPRAAPFFDLGPVVLAVMGLVLLLLLAAILWIIQIIKRILGISLYGEELLEWRPADQHMYQEGERPTLDVGQWKQGNEWSGATSGRGQFFEQQWRGRL